MATSSTGKMQYELHDRRLTLQAVPQDLHLHIHIHSDSSSKTPIITPKWPRSASINEIRSRSPAPPPQDPPFLTIAGSSSLGPKPQPSTPSPPNAVPGPRRPHAPPRPAGTRACAAGPCPAYSRSSSHPAPEPVGACSGVSAGPARTPRPHQPRSLAAPPPPHTPFGSGPQRRDSRGRRRKGERRTPFPRVRLAPNYISQRALRRASADGRSAVSGCRALRAPWGFLRRGPRGLWAAPPGACAGARVGGSGEAVCGRSSVPGRSPARVVSAGPGTCRPQRRQTEFYRFDRDTGRRRGGSRLRATRGSIPAPGITTRAEGGGSSHGAPQASGRPATSPFKKTETE
ncbi:ESX-1 secretion-associated protein EspI-like [Mustela lutreola]|uniref:ESX-1 secretion-associated protein EspI-like n=1 Tax=Mustela lutreola TaxID=9666 RepID=UPI0027973CE7|nr:ESX-1 secretion-associated protein EspI-like [Mustela lutreola]